MRDKRCRLTVASKYAMGGGGGGGSTSIIPEEWKKDLSQFGQGYKFQQGAFNQFQADNPILQTALTGAQGFFKQLPGLISPIQKGLSALPGQFGQYQNQLGGLYGREQGWLKGLQQMISSHGALTRQGERDVAQRQRTIESAYGTAGTTGALGRELLNREAEQERRYNQALSQGSGLVGQLGGLVGQRAGLTGLLQSLTQSGSQAIQGLQSGGLNQLNTTFGNAVSAFGGLQNPILAAASAMLGRNMQGQIAQAGINQQANAASDAKMGGTAGGVASALGSIIGAVAMSDERLKRKIKDTGLKTLEGIPLKRFEYKTQPGREFLFVTAQDVEKKIPEAVIKEPMSGIKFVDVAKVKLPMIELAKQS